MPLFDSPELKVQKNRSICRVTDARIAKYSRWGLLFVLLAFTIAMAMGDLRHQMPRLSLGLGIGLIVVTLWRAYYVFRFETLYAAGPKRWRQRYFIVSTIGAAWWGLALFCHVLIAGFGADTFFLWLYTIIFCSSVAPIFSPYHRFFSWFMALSLIPAALQSLFIEGTFGAIYGALSLAFVWLMSHQAGRESRNYWDRIAAMEVLQQKASSLAEQREHSRAATELTNEFITNIGQEFRGQLSDVLGALTLLEGEKLPQGQSEWVQLAKNSANLQLKLVDKVGLFARVARKEIEVRQSSFNLIQVVETSFNSTAAVAQRQELEFNFEISADLPVMVRGDHRKIVQLLRNLMDSVIAIAHRGELLAQVKFEYVTAAEGQFAIVLNDNGKGEILPKASTLFGAFSRVNTPQVMTGLGLAIAKGLAEAMGGHFEVDSSAEGNRYLVAVKFEIEPRQREYLSVDRRLQDSEILLLHQSGQFVPGLIQTLHSFDVEVLSHSWKGTHVASEKAFSLAVKHKQPILLVPALGDQQLLGEVANYLQHQEEVALSEVKILCLGTGEHKAQFSNLAKLVPQAHYLLRPAARKALHDALVVFLLGETKKTSRRITSAACAREVQRKLLLIDSANSRQGVSETLLRGLGYQTDVVPTVDTALELLAHNNYDLLVVDCQRDSACSADIIASLRHFESSHSPHDRLPIIALTSNAEEQFEARCLAAGMDDMVIKPLDKNNLRRTLERWFGDAA